MRLSNSTQFNKRRALFLVLGFSSIINAATITSQLTISATVSPLCLTPSVATMGFNNYNPASGTALTATTVLNVFCTLTTPFTVSLNVGTGGGSFTTRLMANGANTLQYNLYTSSAYTTVWGDGTGTTGTVASTGAGVLTAQPLTIYGKIPINQYVVATNYSSTITATVTY